MNATYTLSMFSDALERAYSCAVLSEPRQPSVSMKGTARKLGRSLRRGASAVGHLIDDVLNAQAEARARSQRYTNAPW